MTTPAFRIREKHIPARAAYTKFIVEKRDPFVSDDEPDEDQWDEVGYAYVIDEAETMLAMVVQETNDRSLEGAAVVSIHDATGAVIECP